MFGFPNTTHKIFKNNFLKTVIFQISFDENKNCTDKKNEIISLFKAKFPRINENISKGFQISFKQDTQTPILQSLNDKKGIEMKSEDGQNIILINSISFSITVSGRAYTNYNELKEKILEIDDFFKICDIKTVKRIAIRKMNIFEFKIADNPSKVMEYIICPDLLSNFSYLPNSESIKQNIQTINYSIENQHLNLKYGLNIPPYPNKEVGQIIIDIDLFNLSETKRDDIFSIADNMNQEIFKIFNWSISENTLKLLNE